jgi:hypothetical protein
MDDRGLQVRDRDVEPFGRSSRPVLNDGQHVCT